MSTIQGVYAEVFSNPSAGSGVAAVLGTIVRFSGSLYQKTGALDTNWTTPLPTPVPLDGKVKVTAADTTPNYLSSKLASGTNVTLTVLNPGANESISIAAPLDGKVKVTAADTTPNYLSSKLTAGTNITLTVLNPGANESVSIEATGGGGGGGAFLFISPAQRASVFSTTTGVSDATTGAKFQVGAVDVSCTGVDFVPTGMSVGNTIKAAIWNSAGVLVNSANVVAVGGINTATFGAPSTLAASGVYYVSMYDTGAVFKTNYVEDGNLPPLPFNTGSINWIDISLESAGDAAPTSASTPAPVCPVLV